MSREQSIEIFEQAEFKAIIDDFNFSSHVDVNYLYRNVPHVFKLFIDLINKGYFERFRESKEINILEVGCNCAPLVFALEKIKEVLFKRGIDINFKYLGIDVIKPLINELQKITAPGIHFRAIDGSRSDLVRQFMDDCEVKNSDIVFIKRPVVLGAEWMKWIFPSIFILTMLNALLGAGRVNNPAALKREIKNFGITIFFAFVINEMSKITGWQYSSFRNILGGSATENYDDAMVVVTDHYLMEHFAIRHIFSGAYQSNVSSFPIGSFWDGFQNFNDNYGVVVDRYQYQPHLSWFAIEKTIDRGMGLIMLGYATLKVFQLQPMPNIIIKVFGVATLQMLTPPALEIISANRSNIMVFLGLLSGCRLLQASSKLNSTFLALGLILINLPVAGAISYEPSSIEDSVKNISMASMLLWGVSKLLGNSRCIVQSIGSTLYQCSQGVVSLFSSKTTLQKSVVEPTLSCSMDPIFNL